jgi:thioredoxin 1
MTMKFNELINADKPVLVDFYATWCGPCKTQAPMLEELAGKVGDAAKIIKVDIDKNPKAANQYQVRSVPTLMVFKKGKVLWRQSGVVPANQLQKVLMQYA